MSKYYTEKDHADIAWVEYRDFTAVQAKNHIPVSYGESNGHVLGTLDEVVDDKSTGLKMYVVKTDEKHYTVLYQGSQAPNLSDPLGAGADWLLNDFPMAFNISMGIQQPTNQLAKASESLNRLMDKHKDAHFDIYGHSLGSMNAQYALANVTDSSRIDSAHINI
ncbi:hypothetical protein EJ419_02325 [Alloscardovia theropitheci]|uniref:DUF2974 domain-containing protein n=1 Tax=Alloscardovia theropitheci TaxID=2496842 RepID=A0A4R0QYI5_9BIFI|nr:hypothetical protein [Alloscardovia theropitheci]TCD54691.1 hypothetical protein EJ419_02325 [Alloscardovia theropitheci]